jgi:acyl-CoA synthetase (NDP forming)
MTTTTHVEETAARRFLALPRIAVIGASPERGNFGATIASALRQRGTSVVTVHPTGAPVAGMPVFTDVASLAGRVDGAIVMVPATAAADVVRACADAGIHRVWLFRGIGSDGSVSDEAIAAAEGAGIELVAGACPLMFLEPAGWFHRVHRSVRRRRGALVA